MIVFRTIVLGTVFLFVALAAGPLLAVQFDESFPVLAIGLLRYVGIMLLAVGIPLAIYCTSVLFIPGKSRPAPYDAGGIFTIAGPYCYVRNPFLLSVVIALWGEALLLERIVMIAYAFVFTWGIHFWVIFYEEPALLDRFGEEYQTYRDSVPRWLPQLKKYKAEG